MQSPWKLLFGSRKFVVAMLIVVLTPVSVAAARIGLGFDVATTVMTITPGVLGLLGVILGISYEDGQAKGAGSGMTTTTTAGATPAGAPSVVTTTTPVDPDVTPTLPPRGFVHLGLLLAIAVLAVAFIVSCGAMKSGAKTAGGMVVDCLSKQTAKTVLELGPVVDVMLVQAVDPHNRVDFNPVRDLAKRFTPEVGGCVLADAIARALKPKPDDPNAPASSPLEIDRAALRADFEALRAEQFGGVRFKTASGEL